MRCSPDIANRAGRNGGSALNVPTSQAGPRLERVEWCRLTGRRPRRAGSNARLGEHGAAITLDVARITAGGVSGFGWSPITRESARAAVGMRLPPSLPEAGFEGPLAALEFPLLDWMGRMRQCPVYALTSGGKPDAAVRVPCYDTSLYLDDLHLADDGDAVRLLQDEAREGLARGHRAFKIKVGRGARHMPLEEGMRRDAAIVRGVRESVGEDAVLMLDANNGLNLNLTKRLLAETADAGVFWMEEPFHEDSVLYRDLKDWLSAEGLDVLVADGEGDAHPRLVEWAKEGLVDVVQYDIRGYGYLRWLALGAELDAAGVKSAPHQYGGMYGNHAACHLAPAVRGFVSAEWDEATVDGIDAAGYSIGDGKVTVPATPGFGLELDDGWFTEQARHGGFSEAA